MKLQNLIHSRNQNWNFCFWLSQMQGKQTSILKERNVIASQNDKCIPTHRHSKKQLEFQIRVFRYLLDQMFQYYCFLPQKLNKYKILNYEWNLPLADRSVNNSWVTKFTEFAVVAFNRFDLLLKLILINNFGKHSKEYLLLHQNSYECIF